MGRKLPSQSLNFLLERVVKNYLIFKVRLAMNFDAPPLKPEITVETIAKCWEQHAVTLEGLIKGAYFIDGEMTEPDRLCTFEDLLSAINKRLILTPDGPKSFTDEEAIESILALIDFFALPENAQQLINHFDLGGENGYRFIPESVVQAKADDFEIVDGFYLPKALAQEWNLLVKEYQTEIAKVLDDEHTITIASAYRSPAYQVYLLCSGSYIKQSRGALISLADEFKKIAPSHCSEHSNATNPAIDIDEFFPNREATVQGAKSCAEVRATVQWKTFNSLAQKRHFYENWPEGSINDYAGESWEYQKRRLQTDSAITEVTA